MKKLILLTMLFSINCTWSKNPIKVQAENCRVAFARAYTINRTFTKKDMEREKINEQIVKLGEELDRPQYKVAVKNLLINIGSEVSLQMLKELYRSGFLAS